MTLTRRGFVASAAAAVPVAALRPVTAAAQASRDAEALEALLRVEHTSVVAYDHVLATGGLGGERERLARTLRDHEARHAAALAKALTDLRWPLPRPPGRLERVEIPQVRAALEDEPPHEALMAVERLSDEVYRLGMGRLRRGPYIQLAATILAAEASHLVAWRAVR